MARAEASSRSLVGRALALAVTTAVLSGALVVGSGPAHSASAATVSAATVSATTATTAPVASIVARPVTSVVAGSTTSFQVVGLAADGSVVRDLSNDLTGYFLKQSDGSTNTAGPVADGGITSEFTLQILGKTTVTFSAAGFSTEPMTFQVVAAPTTTLVSGATVTTAQAGDTVDLLLSAADAQGAAVPLTGATFSSTAPSDAYSNGAVTFGAAGTRTVTVALRDATFRRDFTVTAKPVVDKPVGTSPSGSSPGDGSVVVTPPVAPITPVTPVTPPVTPPILVQPALVFVGTPATTTDASNPVAFLPRLVGTDGSLSLATGAAYSVVASATGEPLDPAAWSVTGGAVHVTRAGHWLVRVDAAGLSAESPLTVTPWLASTIVGLPTSVPVGSVDLPVTAVDPFGNSVALVDATTTVRDGTSDLVLRLLNGRLTGTIAKAGARTLTLFLNGNEVMERPTITVVAGALTRLALVPAASSFTAGTSNTIAVRGSDAFGNPVPLRTGAYARSAGSGDTLNTTGLVGLSATAVLSGHVAGRRTVAVRDGAVTATTTVTVTPAAVATTVLSGVKAGTRLVAGQRASFLLQARDRFGNAVPTTPAAYSSSSTGDRVTGRTVQFLAPTARARGGATTTVTARFLWLGKTVAASVTGLRVETDTAKLALASGSTAKAGKAFAVTASIGRGAGGYATSGSLRIYYDRKSVSVKLTTARSYRVTIPGLGRGAHSVRVVYVPTGTVYASTATKAKSVTVR